MTTGVHVNYGLATRLTDSVSPHQRMEINTRYPHLQRNDLVSSGVLLNSGNGERANGASDTGLQSSGASTGVVLTASATGVQQSRGLSFHEQHAQFQQQMMQLKQQHQLQQQLLLQQYQQQQQQLAEQHAKQIQVYGEYLVQQKKMEEEQKQERERQEKERLESLKKKERHEQSAIASSEVKQRLQEFVLNKKQREAAANSANNSPPNFRNWSRQHQSLEQASPPTPTTGVSSRYRHPLLSKYDDDFPLRKTASEPNLKVRSVLKQKVIDRRSSPLLRRKDKGPIPIKRRTPLTMEGSSSGSSRADSGPGSPPNGSSAPHSLHSSNGSTPIQEEPCTSPYQLAVDGSLSDLTLYSSPSMPNISLGRPPVHSSPGEGKAAMGASEAQLRAMATATLGMPLTSHLLHSTLPFYPALPVIDGEFTPPTSPSYLQQTKGSGAPTIVPGIYPAGPVLTDVHVAQARLHRNIHRPLGRTQSAPLPLGHPMLQPQGLLLQQNEQYLRDKQLYEQQQHHHLLKQHIRQTVLTRASSKNQVENVEEETEAAVAQEMKEAGIGGQSEERGPEVIDLTEPSKAKEDAGGGTEQEEEEGTSELVRQQRDREAFLQQQRDLMARHSLHISEGSAFTPRHQLQQHILQHQQQQQQQAALASKLATGTAGGLVPLQGPTSGLSIGHPQQPHHQGHHHGARPLSRALSSPLVALSPAVSPQAGDTTPPNRHTFTTGVVYDSLMLKHQCICGDNSQHPEHGGRLQSIWARLQETGLVARCERVRSRKATLEEIQSCHSEAYTLLFGTNPLNRQKLDINQLGELPIKNFVMLPCGGIGVDLDTTWNDLHTASAARMAAGCVTDLALKVAMGEVKNGFAVVRPPGHHAEHQQAMGFCFFNSIAIAAKQLRQRLKLEKILIVDWDVHHGNGLQQIFYDDPHILYISLHRHDNGNFFPGTGDPEEVGVDDGVGFTVNMAWSGALNPPIGDSEYIAAFRCIVMPIARDFDPDIVLVASGFDAATGHPPQLGGYRLSPACFGYMTKQLMQLAKGKVVLALEGGYDLPAVCDCSQECVGVLLGDEGLSLSEEELARKPSQVAVESLQRVIAIQAYHWPCIKRWAHTVPYSMLEAQQKEREESETVTALASLSVAVPNTPQQQSGQMEDQEEGSGNQEEEQEEQTEEPMEEDQDK